MVVIEACEADDALLRCVLVVVTEAGEAEVALMGGVVVVIETEDGEDEEE